MLNNLLPFSGLTVTFNTTEDCNLACKYCYEINKRKKDLPLDYAYKFIDILTSDDNPINIDKQSSYLDGDKGLEGLIKHGIILDFIGGDALMNVDTVENIIQYFIYKVNMSNTEYCKNWKNNWRVSISSNGTLFGDPKIRKFLEKWHEVISLSVSIDGCPAIHDKNRIFKNKDAEGNEVGSMNTIIKYRDWFKRWFPVGGITTKSTCAKDSIPYLYESLKFMYESLGIAYINQNFIMEDMHLTNEDYALLDDQLKKCVIYTLQHKDELYWSMIDYHNFASTYIPDPNQSRCGSGSMPCLGINGKIYSCFRWAPHTQTALTKDKMIVGDINKGFYLKENFEKVRNGATYGVCTKEERCTTCEYSSACSYCIGGCYAEYGDFVRTTHICEVTKLQCKWAKVYWNEYHKLRGEPLEFDERYTLDKVAKWTPKYIGTNKSF